MNSAFGWMKRIGAIFVIIVLILMMGLIFSSQPIDEIIQVFSGGTNIGEFDGEQIPARYYSILKTVAKNGSANRSIKTSHFSSSTVSNNASAKHTYWQNSGNAWPSRPTPT